MFWLRLPLRRPPLPHTLCSRLTAPMWEAAAKTGDVPRMRLLQGNPSSPPPAVERLDLARCTATGHVGPMPHRWRLLLAGLFAVLAVRVNPDRLEPVSLDDNTPSSSGAGRPLCEAPANGCVAPTLVVCSSACRARVPRLGLGRG